METTSDLNVRASALRLGDLRIGQGGYKLTIYIEELFLLIDSRLTNYTNKMTFPREFGQVIRENRIRNTAPIICS